MKGNSKNSIRDSALGGSPGENRRSHGLARWTHAWLAFTLALLGSISQAGHAEVETITWLVTDHLDSPILARDANQNTVWEEDYSPWGERLTQPAANPADLSFTGHYEEADLGLVYAGARWYDPEIGRFLSPDPVGFLDGGANHFNRYAYANNNPMIYVDPDGQIFQAAFAVAGIAALATFSEYANAPGLGEAPVSRSNIERLGALSVGPLGRVGAGAVAARAGVTKGVDDLFKAGRTPKASELTKYAEQQGWKPSQAANGPLKYIDENGVNRLTIKQGSSRAPGSANPHVELRNASGQRVDPAGNPVTRKSPGNHTPIDFDL